MTVNFPSPFTVFTLYQRLSLPACQRLAQSYNQYLFVPLFRRMGEERVSTLPKVSSALARLSPRSPSASYYWLSAAHQRFLLAITDALYPFIAFDQSRISIAYWSNDALFFFYHRAYRKYQRRQFISPRPSV